MQRVGEGHKRLNRDVLRPALDSLKVATIKAGSLDQIVLREPKIPSVGAYVRCDRTQDNRGRSRRHDAHVAVDTSSE